MRWRLSTLADDDAVVDMCAALNRDDPGPFEVPSSHTRRTLALFRAEPWRGRCAVLDDDGRLAGYALMVAFWSNEYGGVVVEVDELFVAAEHRSQGHGRALLEAVADGQFLPTSTPAIAALDRKAEAKGVSLIVRPDNTRARALYESLGFEVAGLTMVHRRTPT